MIKWICIILSLLILLAGCVNQWPATYRIKFDEPACIKPFKGYHYQTCRIIQVEMNDSLIEIPHDFDTDLASIPRWYWSIASPAFSGFVAPSILHDYLYGCPNGRSRYEIDSIFYSALRENEVSFMTSIKMYFGVRLFGRTHFNQGHYCFNQFAYVKKKYKDEC